MALTAAQIIYYYYGPGGGAPAPEVDVPEGEPSIEITGTKIISTGAGAQDWHGRTACKVLPDTTVVLIYRVASAHNVNDDGELHIRFSPPGSYGETWTDANKNIDGSDVTGFPWRPASFISTEGPGEPWLIIAPNGDLLVFGWEIDFGVAGGGTWYSRSSDGGKTWTTPAQITVINLPADCSQNSNFMTNDDFVLGNTIYLSAWNNDGPGNISTFIKSDDNGATWEFVSKITDSDIDTDVLNYEAGLCYVGNDKIISIMRNGSNSATLYKTSTDLGQTWGALSDVSSWGLTARHRFFQRSRAKGKANWWLDPVILTSIFTHAVPGSSQTRINGIQISKDFGVTFPYVRHLDLPFEDGGYNDWFYNPVTSEYVILGYRGLLTDAEVVQYNFTVTWGTPFSTHSLSLASASSQTVNLGTHADIQFESNDAFSIFLRFKRNGNPSGSEVLLSNLGATGRGILILMLTTGVIHVEIRNTASTNRYILESSTGYADNEWHTMLFTKPVAFANSDLLMDRISDIASEFNNLTATIVSTEDLIIGNRESQSVYFNGLIDQVAIWNSDQSANRNLIYNGVTKNLALLADPPLHYWEINDGANDAAKFADTGDSANNLPGTGINDPTISTDV